ncbi:MAG: hypothetical protein BAJALOKI3v1_300038 [Promethearchaeota archaeon]|nr:MAG: hypothetical protein BAJALOKI3v1_300038 [Candidatus Lokiarchaeota archaeon]
MRVKIIKLKQVYPFYPIQGNNFIMEYRKEPHRVYSLIYDLIVIGKYHQPVCIKETGSSGITVIS